MSKNDGPNKEFFDRLDRHERSRKMATEISQSDFEITLTVEQDLDELNVGVMGRGGLPEGLLGAIEIWCESDAGIEYAEKKLQQRKDRDDGGDDRRYHDAVDEGRA